MLFSHEQCDNNKPNRKLDKAVRTKRYSAACRHIHARPSHADGGFFLRKNFTVSDNGSGRQIIEHFEFWTIITNQIHKYRVWETIRCYVLGRFMFPPTQPHSRLALHSLCNYLQANSSPHRRSTIQHAIIWLRNRFTLRLLRIFSNLRGTTIFGFVYAATGFSINQI